MLERLPLLTKLPQGQGKGVISPLEMGITCVGENPPQGSFTLGYPSLVTKQSLRVNESKPADAAGPATSSKDGWIRLERQRSEHLRRKDGTRTFGFAPNIYWCQLNIF